MFPLADLCTTARGRSRASSAARRSSGARPCPLTSSYTRTPGPTRASTAERGSTRSRTWRSTLTYTQVRNGSEHQSEWSLLFFCSIVKIDIIVHTYRWDMVKNHHQNWVYYCFVVKQKLTLHAHRWEMVKNCRTICVV